jgi:transcriptional regulator with XRE-family HTH domain
MGLPYIGCARLYGNQMSRQKPTETTVEESVIIRRVSRQLNRIAHERGMTAKELSGVLGLSYAYVRDILDGKRNITVLILEDMCLKLGVPLEIMLGAYLHAEQEPVQLPSRWGAKRAQAAELSAGPASAGVKQPRKRSTIN